MDHSGVSFAKMAPTSSFDSCTDELSLSLSESLFKELEILTSSDLVTLHNTCSSDVAVLQ